MLILSRLNTHKQENKRRWLLLDSLQSGPKVVPNETELLKKNQNAGRASVMVTPDTTKTAHVIPISL